MDICKISYNEVQRNPLHILPCKTFRFLDEMVVLIFTEIFIRFSYSEKNATLYQNYNFAKSSPWSCAG